MNKLSTKDRVAILNALSEGVGVNATCRVTGKSKNTVLKLLAEVGAACAQYQDNARRNLTIEHVQCDEIWSFVGAKQKNVRPDDAAHADYGDVFTFTAMDPVTKLLPCWLVGTRNLPCTEDFMLDLAARLSNRVQLTTEGWKAYPIAVDNAFSKKLENHMHAVSFIFMVYNFVKIHKTIKTTPAMEAGVTSYLWSMEDIVMMADTHKSA